MSRNNSLVNHGVGAAARPASQMRHARLDSAPGGSRPVSCTGNRSHSGDDELFFGAQWPRDGMRIYDQVKGLIHSPVDQKGLQSAPWTRSGAWCRNCESPARLLPPSMSAGRLRRVDRLLTSDHSSHQAAARALSAVLVSDLRLAAMRSRSAACAPKLGGLCTRRRREPSRTHRSCAAYRQRSLQQTRRAGSVPGLRPTERTHLSPLVGA